MKLIPLGQKPQALDFPAIINNVAIIAKWCRNFLQIFRLHNDLFITQVLRNFNKEQKELLRPWPIVLEM